MPIPPTSAEIIADIETKIAEKAPGYRPGNELPSTRTLATQYDVSTATIYRAVAVLRQRGALVGRKGRGVFVADTQLPQQ